MKGRGLMVAPVTAGYRTDLEALLSQFQTAGEVSFDTFRQLFLDFKFGTVFCGRETEQEMRELIEKVFVLTLNYVLNERELAKRAGALMALYGLYYLQPKNCKCLIAVTLEKLLKLQEVTKELEELGLKDVLYCAIRLFRDQAFVLSVLSEEMNPLTSKAYDNPGDDLSAAQLASQFAIRVDKDIVRRLASDAAVQGLRETHKEYVAKKASLPLHDVGASLRLVNDGIDVYLSAIADDTDDKIQRRTNRSQPHSAKATIKTGSESEDSPMKRRRDALRSKAYHGLAKAARHRRHRQLSTRGGAVHNDAPAQEPDLVALLQPTAAEQQAPPPSEKTPKKRGRPKGSRNSPKASSAEQGKARSPRKRRQAEQAHQVSAETEEAGKRKRTLKVRAPLNLSEDSAFAAALQPPAKVRPQRKPKAASASKVLPKGGGEELEQRAVQEPKAKGPRGRRRLADKAAELEVVTHE